MTFLCIKAFMWVDKKYSINLKLMEVEIMKRETRQVTVNLS